MRPADLRALRAGRFFYSVTGHPRTFIAIGLACVFATAAFLPRIEKDTSAEAFVPPDHSSVIYRDKVKQIFGLSGPVVVAIVNEAENGIFNPSTLRLISWFTERISEIPGVDPQRITSLATEKNIRGTEDEMIVEPFFESPPETQVEADRIRSAVMDFPLYLGDLVARDGKATLIVAELLGEEHGAKVYKQLLALIDEAPVNGEKIHAAGEGAVSDYIGSYIESDALRLNPIGAIIVTGILFLSYRTLRGVVVPGAVVIGAVTIALGSMTAGGVPFYVITNALPVILVAIGVADGIHILGQYYEEIAARPGDPQRELVVRSMVEMWRPVTITSISDIAGFLAIAFSTSMPPMRAFGLYASLGVLAALALSLFVIPSILTLLPPRSSAAFDAKRGVDRFGRVAAGLGRWVLRHPVFLLTAAGLVIVAGITGIARLEVNDAPIENFKHTEPIYVANAAMNQRMNGTNYLDVVIETPEAEDLFKPENLRRIEALQEFLEKQPHVNGSTSIVDYLKQMNRVMNDGRPEAYRLPDNENLVAQYFLLYSASGDPTDFEKMVDYDYRQANVRATLDSGLFQDVREAVESAERYVEAAFDSPGITASITGRVHVDYHWMHSLSRNHFRGVILALVAVWGMASISFRSAVAGALTVLPVALSVLLIYAVMGFAGISLGIGTSMFAAIAIGLGVDFAVHTLDRIIVLVREENCELEDSLSAMFPSTGRALLFNFSAVLLGFGVVSLSDVPALIRFGSLVGVAVLVSFIASQTVLPALVKVLKPGFLTRI